MVHFFEQVFLAFLSAMMLFIILEISSPSGKLW